MTRGAGRALAVGFAAAVVYLAASGLGTPAVWDDEAQTAIVARSFLASGRLSAWDGPNLYAYRNASLVREDGTVDVPPLQVFVTAASFAVLGESNTAARLPFVLAGLGGLALFADLLRRRYGPWSPVTRYAVGLLGTSVVFLLNIRQCRYYALSLLLAVWTLHAWDRVRRHGRASSCLELAAALVLSFYAHPLLATAFAGALAAVEVILRRRLPTHGRRIAATLLLAASLTAPYAVSHRLWERRDVGRDLDTPWTERRPLLAWWNVRDLNRLTALPWAPTLAILLALVVAARRGEAVRDDLEPLVLATANAAAIGLLSIQPVVRDTPADVRYLIASLPFGLWFLATGLTRLHARSPPLAVAAAAVLASSTILGTTIGQPPRWLLPAYLAEVHAPYPTGTSESVRHLEARVRDGQALAVLPDHMTYPVQFYLGARVRTCCMLGAEAAGRFPGHPHLHRASAVPDWILAFEEGPDLRRYLGRLREAGASYEAAVLPVFAGQTQRPELHLHHFGPRRDFNPRLEGVLVFARRGR